MVREMASGFVQKLSNIHPVALSLYQIKGHGANRE
jgi:hypothetical protein